MYLIAYCPNCSKLMIANTSNNTRTCPNCGAKSRLFSLQVIARVENSQEATAIIQKMKEKTAASDRVPQYKKFKINK